MSPSPTRTGPWLLLRVLRTSGDASDSGGLSSARKVLMEAWCTGVVQEPACPSCRSSGRCKDHGPFSRGSPCETTSPAKQWMFVLYLNSQPLVETPTARAPGRIKKMTVSAALPEALYLQSDSGVKATGNPDDCCHMTLLCLKIPSPSARR